MKQVKQRANFIIIVLVALLTTVFLVTITKDKERLLDQKTQTHRQLLRNSFDLALQETQQGLSALAYNIAKDGAIVDAFEAKDRDRLYKLSKPYYDKAKEDGLVDVSGFIDANGTHFLRLQDPTLYGDNLMQKRPILAKAINSKEPLVSIDVTIYDVSIISIVPIFKYDNYLGVIHTVAHMKRVQDRLNKYSDIMSAIIYKTDKIKALLPNADFKTINDYSIVSSNSTIFEHLPKGYNFEDSKRERIDGLDYLVASRKLFNANQEEVAMIICAFDISEDVANYKKETINLTILSLALLVGVSFVLHYTFNLMLKRIEKDTKLTQGLNEKLSFQLNHEPLTLLPNRNKLLSDLLSIKHYALALINIDSFKEINDFYGHDFGDKVLLSLSNILKQLIKSYPITLYKMPSDEFALAITKELNDTEIKEIFEKISASISQHSYNIHNISLYITCSIGVCIDKSLTNELLTNADLALKTAKKQNVSMLYYSDNLQTKKDYQNNILWSKKLKDAISNNSFKLLYQPIFCIKSGTILKYEALIRMVDEDNSLISPFFFLQAAKRSRLYPLLTKFVVDNVFEKLKTSTFIYSLNISILDILDVDTKEYIFTKLKESDASNRVVFELLESEGVDNYKEVSEFIAKVKSYGSKIAIDDFGTGYSNFAHIIKLDVDILKIDGSLIKNIDTDINAQTIVMAVVEFSKRLNIEVVAEFVHSKEVYDKCIELGVGYLQGYYLSEPISLI